jgi:uncharacterized membrane protein
MTVSGRRLRRYFFTGLIVLAPVGVTAVILVWMFRAIDDILGQPLQAALGFRIPGLGFIVLVLVVTVVGWAVHLAAGRKLLNLWNEAMARFPLTGRMYTALSHIAQSVIGDRKRLFHRTVLVPYPKDGIWAVGFVTNEQAPVMSRVVGEPCVNVFVPTTPNPTSGFMLVVPRAEARDAGVSVEEAMKLIISAGAVSPGETPLVVRRGLDLDSLLRDSVG